MSGGPLRCPGANTSARRTRDSDGFVGCALRADCGRALPDDGGRSRSQPWWVRSLGQGFPSRARVAGGNALLALVSTVLILGLLEGVAHLAGVTLRSRDEAYIRSLQIRNCQVKYRMAVEMCAPGRVSTSRPHLVVALGGSSVQGWPPGRTVPFPNQLQMLLDAAHAGQFTVVNLGLMCKDSIYVRQCAETVISAHPDILIVYAGENSVANWGFAEPERAIFLEENAWLYDLDALLSHTRTYSLVARKLERPVFPATWVEAQLSDERFERSRQVILAKYRRDISRVIEVAREHGADVILVTQVSNLYEYPIRKAAWDIPRAPPTPHTRMARSAEHFWNGVALFRTERFEEALAEFKQARDLDPRGRTPSQLNDIVRELGTEREHVHLVDFERELEQVGVREGIGCNFFGDEDVCDQFHPNTRTNHLIAEALLRAIERLELPATHAALGRRYD
jgi:lysophospholipase L1-like esterase